MPWVKNLDSAINQQLTAYYNNLTRLATIAKNNPNQWLLSEVETRIQINPYKLSDRLLGLNFSDWSPLDVKVGELILDKNFIRAGLFYLELRDIDLAELVYTLLTLNIDEDTSVSTATMQKLLIPHDYTALMQDYRQRLDNFRQVEADFFSVLTQIDQIVYQMFGMTSEEQKHIETRLSSFPLDKLKPRYPWQAVRSRSIKAYTEDRFT